MTDTVHPEHLWQVDKAAASLEKDESEYSLKTLANQAALTEDDVLTVLKEYWVKHDKLDILHLDLNEEEEACVYTDS